MTLVYFDSSALVKLLVEEEGSELAAQLRDGCDAALSSRLAYPEVRAALAAAHRNRDLNEDGRTSAEHAWEDYWAATRPVELTPTGQRRAGELTRLHARRGADSVHLASALAIESADAGAQALRVDSCGLLSEHQRRGAVDVDLRTEGRRSRGGRGRRDEPGGQRKQRLQVFEYPAGSLRRPRDRRRERPPRLADAVVIAV